MPGDIHRIREEETPSMADQLRMYFVIVDIPYWYLHPFANVDIVLSSNDVTIRVVWHFVSSGGVADNQHMLTYNTALSIPQSLFCRFDTFISRFERVLIDVDISC